MNPSSSIFDLGQTEQLNQWLDAQEGEHYEFKEAKNRYSFEELSHYCCALANEGGGKMILGATNKRPRRIVNSQAFMQYEETRRSLMEKIPLRIEVVEIRHPDGRALVFNIPSRPVGVPIKCDGVYWSREADSLVPMSEGKLRAIFDEAGRDFSAEICHDAGPGDLDSQAIESFRRRWMEKSKNSALAAVDSVQLLRDAELVIDGGITYAALILFGSRQALGRLLGQAEVVYEYRSSNASGPAQQRKEYRQGFFSFYDDLWQTINLRNDLQHFQDGLFILDIPTFAERSVREILLNAVGHRNYQLGGSVFIRQYPRRLVVESPGGFPVGVTVENILDRQSPRNRRISDAFAKCGLVERSGQGMNLIFEQSIRQGKRRPDFTGTDAYNVVLALPGEVADPQFVRFLERVAQETNAPFDTHDFLIMDLVHREEPIPPILSPRFRRLADLGVVESVGRGKGVRSFLSRRFYTMIGKKGSYTRKKGLDRETNKELLLKHLRENPQGSPLSELHQVHPQLSRRMVQTLLRELLAEDKVRIEGARRWALWKAKDI